MSVYLEASYTLRLLQIEHNSRNIIYTYIHFIYFIYLFLK